MKYSNFNGFILVYTMLVLLAAGISAGALAMFKKNIIISARRLQSRDRLILLLKINEKKIGDSCFFTNQTEENLVWNDSACRLHAIFYTNRQEKENGEIIFSGVSESLDSRVHYVCAQAEITNKLSALTAYFFWQKEGSWKYDGLLLKTP
ncbi:MAG: hypothetical protein A2096_07905 [Spirochaetes bacterium GWF1_41_5]|nr:MAG: hypothetical protein A2096_07905 [Spirochaetes bacterium GWF1_41_5]